MQSLRAPLTGYTAWVRRLALLLLLASVRASAAEPDPAGTVVLRLRIGETAPVIGEAGASVLCDDVHVATGEFTADGKGFVIRALHPGSTLCGVWHAGQTPGGLYRVDVRAEPADAGAQHAPAADAGAADAGAADGGPG